MFGIFKKKNKKLHKLALENYKKVLENELRLLKAYEFVLAIELVEEEILQVNEKLEK